jgi:hypothetical protein
MLRGYSDRLPSPEATLVSVGDAEQRRAGDDQLRRARLNQRLRQAFIPGAEEDSRQRLGRGLTAEELERELRGARSGSSEPKMSVRAEVGY